MAEFAVGMVVKEEDLAEMKLPSLSLPQRLGIVLATQSEPTRAEELFRLAAIDHRNVPDGDARQIHRLLKKTQTSEYPHPCLHSLHFIASAERAGFLEQLGLNSRYITLNG